MSILPEVGLWLLSIAVYVGDNVNVVLGDIHESAAI
jgi:hypothetical protein